MVNSKHGLLGHTLWLVFLAGVNSHSPLWRTHRSWWPLNTRTDHCPLFPGSGCADGTTEGFQNDRHPNIAACDGHWQGHVQNSSHLCAPGWQVCSYREEGLLKGIEWADATAMPGCYAFNAAQDGGQCQPCTSHLEQDDLAGVGGGCAHQSYGQRSCISGGQIAVSCCVDTHFGQACSFRPGLATGVLCCRLPGNEHSMRNTWTAGWILVFSLLSGVPPQILVEPQRMTHVTSGVTFVLSCQAMGSPTPVVTWYRNGHTLPANESRISTFDSGQMSRLRFLLKFFLKTLSFNCMGCFQVICSSQRRGQRILQTMNAMSQTVLAAIHLLPKFLSQVGYCGARIKSCAYIKHCASFLQITHRDAVMAQRTHSSSMRRSRHAREHGKVTWRGGGACVQKAGKCATLAIPLFWKCWPGRMQQIQRVAMHTMQPMPLTSVLGEYATWRDWRTHPFEVWCSSGVIVGTWQALDVIAAGSGDTTGHAWPRAGWMSSGPEMTTAAITTLMWCLVCSAAGAHADPEVSLEDLDYVR